MMGEIMQFPETVEEFMQQYKITDTQQVYTNGTELVPIFRMKQWFEAHKQRWIPCSERLPEDVSRCIVCRYDYVTKTRFIDILWFEHGIWWNRLHGGDYAVTHWQPLPEPPEEEKQNER